MSNTIRNLLQRAIDTHGAQIQIFKTVEEMGELTQALAKLAGNADAPNPDYNQMVDHIAEEVADVRIMLNAPALLHEVQAPAAPGWHPEDAPGLVAPDGSVKGATAKDQICMIYAIEDRAGQWRNHKLARLKERIDRKEGLDHREVPNDV